MVRNFSGLPDANYSFNVTVVDWSGSLFTNETRNVIVDTTSPLASFGQGTDGNNTNVTRSWLFVNITVSELYIKNVTIDLWNNTGLVNRTNLSGAGGIAGSGSNLSFRINFTNLPQQSSGLPDAVYYFNATVYDVTEKNVRTDTWTTVVNTTALVECQQLSSTEKVYTLLNNVYSTSTCFDVRASGITLNCQDYSISYGNLSSGYGINVTGVNSTTVKNCFFLHENSSVIYAPAIYATLANNSLFVNNKVNTTGNLSYGIEIFRSNFTNISKIAINTTGNFTYGISVLTSSRNNLTDNNVSTRGRSNTYGINITTSNNNILIGNTVKTSGTNNKNYAIHLFSSSNNNVSSNTAIARGSDNTYGVYLQSGSNNDVSSNTVNTSGTNSDNYGVSLIDTSNNIVSSNTVNTSGTDSNFGVFLSSSSYNIVKSNTITTSGTSSDNYGIYLFSASNSTNVSDNTVRTGGTSNNFGMLLDTSSVNNVVSTNTLITGGTAGSNYGIIVYRSDNNVSSNTVNTSGTDSNHGVYLAQNADYNLIGKNFINTSTTASYGILAQDSGASDPNSNNITGNIILTRAAVSHGIFLFTDAGNNLVVNNVVNTTGVESHGITLGSANLNNFTGNNVTINANITFGIFLNASNSNNFTDNIIKTFYNLSFGVQLQNNSGNVPTNNTFYNNIFNTTALAVNVTDASFENFWNTSKTSATNIVGGTNLGGNYYDNYSAGGQAALSLNCTDYDNDRICDVSLTHATKNVDFLPLAALVTDTISPNVTIISPLAGASLNQSFSVNASVNDSKSNVNVVHLIVYNNTRNVSGLIVMSRYAGTNTSGYWNVTFDPLTAREGTHNLSVNVTDVRGNSAISTNVSVLIDTISPTLNYAAPGFANASFVNVSWIFLNFSFTETNNGSLMIRNGSTNFTAVNRSEGPTGTKFFWYNFTNRPDGNYTFFGWINDSTGSVAQTLNRTIVVDTVGPAIAL
ncbi:MAG: NosD domain-containing protein, partial [Nanoarchaeota archaeon]